MSSAVARVLMKPRFYESLHEEYRQDMSNVHFNTDYYWYGFRDFIRKKFNCTVGPKSVLVFPNKHYYLVFLMKYNDHVSDFK